MAHHGDCVGADAEFHDLCRDEPHSFIVVHPGPVDDLPNQAGRIGDERRAAFPHMRRNKNIVLASTVLLAAPFELTQQPYGGTWRTIDMARKAKRPLAIVSRDGAMTVQGDEAIGAEISLDPPQSSDTHRANRSSPRALMKST